MNATHFIHRNGHIPLMAGYVEGVGYRPVFPSISTPEDNESMVYAVFKEVDGDKGLRNATHFHWNLKKLSMSVSCSLTYAMDIGGGPPKTDTIEQGHTAYNPQGGLYNVEPAPTEEASIPQPAGNSRYSQNTSLRFDYFHPILEEQWKYDQSLIAVTCSFPQVLFIESLQRWVADVRAHGEATSAVWNKDRTTRKGFGYVDFTVISPGAAAPYSLPHLTDVTLPEIFEAGNKIAYRTGYGDSATVAVTVSAEYWTYAT